jgi:diguanylate cyclase (GGDEF)-like protein
MTTLLPLEALLQALPQPAWVMCPAERRVLAANAAAATLLGLPLAQLLQTPADELLQSPEDQAWWAEASAGPPSALHSDTLVLLPDARLLPVTRSIRGLPADAAPSRLCLVTVLDRSADHDSEGERDALLAQLQATLDSTADGILVTDLQGRVRACNRAFMAVWGLAAGASGGAAGGGEGDPAFARAATGATAPVYPALPAAGRADPIAWMRAHVLDGDGHDARLRELLAAPQATSHDELQLLDGRVLERVSRPLEHGGRVQGRVFAFRDLSERRQAERRIQALTRCDALTGLPNRREAHDRIDAACAGARRQAEGFALLLLDLDHFRRINETWGHDTGDQVLLAAAQRLQVAVRTGDTLMRVGGDQFVLLMPGADARAVEATARRLLKAVAQPCDLDGEPFTLTCSIGVVLCPAHGGTADDLLRHAETALRQAKSAGRAGWRLHQQRQEADRRQQMKLDQALRQALASQRLRLHYQPRVALADSRLRGAEALLRWRDPALGDVSPGVFIPAAEHSGLIVAIGDWVLHQAVRQAALWHGAGHAVPIAVNVSALQFQQPQFVERVANALAVSGLPPKLLELELTESILVHDAEDALPRLFALSALGVGLAIDDFGTGYSSLAYLKRMPVATLKIDRSFVKGLPEDRTDAGIVRAILEMARALGMDVIAEGVETEPQREFLALAGCDACQGWLFAPALDSLSFEQRFLRAPPAAGAALAVLPAPLQPHPGHGGGAGDAGAPAAAAAATAATAAAARRARVRLVSG